MNILFMAPQILIAEHYERDFEIIFHVKAAQNFAAERYRIDFDMIFHFEAAQNFVAKHYKSRFLHDIPLKCSSKIGCRTLCK